MSAGSNVSPDAGTRIGARVLFVSAAAALLAGSLYVNALHNPFVYDDYHTIVANTSIVSVTNLRAIVLHDITRPIVNLSYASDRALWGASPFGFHLTNVLLHMVNIVLLFRLVWRLVDDRGGRATEVASAAAALFGVHPMMTEAVGYVSGRSEVLCATWFLSGLLCARRWIRSSTGSERGGAKWAVLVVAFWCAALATKETAAMFPFVLVALDWTVYGTASERRRRFMRLYLPLIAIAVVGGIVRIAILRVEYAGRVSVHWRYLLVELDVMRRYVWLLIRPVGQSLFHEVAAVNGLLELRALLAIAFTGVMLAAAWMLRNVERLASFGIIWFVLLLLPSTVLAVLDQGEPMAEHRIYLASCGLFLASGIGIGRIDAWLDRAGVRMQWLGGAVMALVLLAFSVQTLLRNAIWRDPITLWQESVNLAPAHYRPRLLLGEALQDKGRRQEAIEQYQTAIRLRPSDIDGYLKLGLCLADMGRIDEARQTFRQALTVDPSNDPARKALALLDKVTTS